MIGEERLTIPIASIREESPTVKTFLFAMPIHSKPGQFVMVTDFVNGEKPFSPSSSDAQGFSLTVRSVGPFTEALCRAHAGDIVSIRGAFGSSFFVPGSRVRRDCLIVGGGCGSPPLHHLAQTLVAQGHGVTMINGAKTSEEVLFTRHFEKLGLRLLSVSEDGGLPVSGTAVDVAINLLREERFDYAYVAGPELMMKAMIPVLQDAEIKSQLLLERYMKCGIGICGSCAMDPTGIRACVDGPVFDLDTLTSVTEFGVYHRTASGHVEGIGGCSWQG